MVASLRRSPQRRPLVRSGPGRAVVNVGRLVYVNLIVSYWESRYELGQLSDVHLRAGASRLFQAQPGLRFWVDTRSLRVETAVGRRARRFHRILDKEYLKAITRSPQP